MIRDDVEMVTLREGGRDAGAEEPLITSDGENDDEIDSGSAGVPEQTRAALHKAGWTVWLLTISAGISGLLFGYDTGVISSTLVSVGADLSQRELTTTDKSVITAITSFFALLSAPITGYLADKYGRRHVILVANLLFLLGAATQALASTVPIMVIGRAAVGAAVGLASCATPLYITELAPAEMRGRLVTIQSLFITGGQVVAYLIGWAFAKRAGGWRWMVGLGAAPALLQLVLLVFMSETPRWLVQANRENKARSVLHRIYSGLTEIERRRTVESVVLDIQAEIAAEAKVGGANPDLASDNSRLMDTAKHLLLVPGNRRALTIACMLQGTQQLCGFNSLMYFSASIFALLGFRNPITTSLSVALTNFALTVAAFGLIDTIGRRRILLYSIPVMTLALGLCSFAFYNLTDLRPGAKQPEVAQENNNHSIWPGTLLGAMLIYVAAYAIGLGCVPWQQSELFPLRVRSLGSGIATATNWTANTVVGVSFLPMMEYLSPSITFAVYALVCLFGWAGVWWIYPETAGLQLEGIAELLNDGWGVKKSLERFKLKNSHSLSRRKQQASLLSSFVQRFRS